MPNNSNNDVFKIIWYQDFYLFLLALAILTIFTIMILFRFPNDEQVAQGLFTSVIAWAGAVVGFYFGQKPVKDMITRIEETNKYVQKKVEITDKIVTDGYRAGDFIEELIKKNRQLKLKIKELENK